MNGKGLFVVLEGIDGSGTTTQAARLEAHFESLGRKVLTTREPTTGPIGTMIRQALGRRLVVPSDPPRPPRFETMALLFAADRMDHLEVEVEPALAEGQVVISDRYVHSSVAYQALTAPPGIAENQLVDWIIQINARARRPDVTVVLDVPPEVGEARLKVRGSVGTRREIYEEGGLQERLARFYGSLENHFPHDRILHVDGTGEIEEVTERIYNALKEAVPSDFA